MKKYIFSIIMALVLATPGLVALAIAEEKVTPFEKRDGNKDGNISMEEFMALPKARLEADFKAADTNNDGVLSKEEWKAKNKARKAARDKK